MKRIKSGSLVYEYLDALGLLQAGTAEELTTARIQFWAEYKAAWKQTKRASTRGITVLYSRSEYAVLKRCANRHHSSVTSFVKKTSLAYIDRMYVVPDVLCIRKMLQYLALTEHTLVTLEESIPLPKDAATHVIKTIGELELVIRQSLYHPPLLLSILAVHYHTNNSFKASVDAIISTNHHGNSTHLD